MVKESKNQQRERSLVERFHKLMLANQGRVEIKESDPDSGGTSMTVYYKNDSITIALAENSEETKRNIY